MVQDFSGRRRSRGRFAENLARTKTLYVHWSNEETIREAAFVTGIPEGSVSRYYKKFNLRARTEGRPPMDSVEPLFQEPKEVGTTEEETKEDLSRSYVAKVSKFQLLWKTFLVNPKNPQVAMDTAKFLELLEQKYLPTDKEMEAAGVSLDQLLVQLGLPADTVILAKAIEQMQKAGDGAPHSEARIKTHKAVYPRKRRSTMMELMRQDSLKKSRMGTTEPQFTT